MKSQSENSSSQEAPQPPVDVNLPSLYQKIARGWSDAHREQLLDPDIAQLFESGLEAVQEQYRVANTSGDILRKADRSFTLVLRKCGGDLKRLIQGRERDVQAHPVDPKHQTAAVTQRFTPWCQQEIAFARLQAKPDSKTPEQTASEDGIREQPEHNVVSRAKFDGSRKTWHSGNVGTEVRQEIDKGSEQTVEQMPLADVFDRVTARDLEALSQEERRKLLGLLSEASNSDQTFAKSVQALLEHYRGAAADEKRRFVDGLSVSERDHLKSELERVEKAQFLMLVFGSDRPSLVNFNVWLKKQSGQKYEFDLAMRVSRATTYVRNLLKAQLLIQGEGIWTPCYITAEKLPSGSGRFIVRRSAVAADTGVKQVEFPSLKAEKEPKLDLTGTRPTIG